MRPSAHCPPVPGACGDLQRGRPASRRAWQAVGRARARRASHSQRICQPRHSHAAARRLAEGGDDEARLDRAGVDSRGYRVWRACAPCSPPPAFQPTPQTPSPPSPQAPRPPTGAAFLRSARSNATAVTASATAVAAAPPAHTLCPPLRLSRHWLVPQKTSPRRLPLSPHICAIAWQPLLECRPRRRRRRHHRRCYPLCRRCHSCSRRDRPDNGVAALISTQKQP